MRKQIENCVENYINGNLTDAKTRAKRIPWRTLFLALMEGYGWDNRKAKETADYLKGLGEFPATLENRRSERV